MLDKQSLTLLLLIFLCGRKKGFCSQEAWPQQVSLQLRQFFFPHTSLCSRREIGNPPPSIHYLEMLSTPWVRVLPQAPLTVLDAFDQILEIETGLVFRERFEGGHFHHRPEKSIHA